MTRIAHVTEDPAVSLLWAAEAVVGGGGPAASQRDQELCLPRDQPRGM